MAENFGVDLSALMAAGIIPALVGLAGTVIICTLLSGKGRKKNDTQEEQSIKVNTQPMGLPSIGSAIIGPLVAVVLLMLRPICGITVDPLIALPAGATASSSAGATIASATFSETITQIVPALYGAAMLHAGTIVLDSLPHGSIFHASAGAMGMPINERMKLLPIDILEGFIIVLASTIVYGIIL